jgi:hypothetical protein
MSKLPPIPPEQRAFKNERTDIDDNRDGRRDRKTGLQSDQPGDADTNLDQQGRQANTRQNLTTHWKTQDR